MDDPEAIAEHIAASPGLRAKFFDDPGGAVGKMVPMFRRQLRAEVIAKVPDKLRSGERASSLHADAVMRQFFAGAIRNPQFSFFTILGLSILAFLAGLCLIGAGVYIGISTDTTRETIVASVFSGAGAGGVIGSVYRLASGGVRLANADHAQIRLILTGFATELGHLRAYKLDDLDDITRVNAKIREAMRIAVNLVQSHVKDEDMIASATGVVPEAEQPVEAPEAEQPSEEPKVSEEAGVTSTGAGAQAGGTAASAPAHRAPPGQ